MYCRWIAAGFCLFLIASGCGSDDDAAEPPFLGAAREACSDAARFRESACERRCARLQEESAAEDCSAACESELVSSTAGCEAVLDPAAVACASAQTCEGDVLDCRAAAAAADLECRSGCGPEDVRCLAQCDVTRAAGESACAFATARAEVGAASLPDFATGRPADLSVLLDENELAVVEEADQRATDLRSRPLRFFLGRAGVEVKIEQARHDFSFGFPVDFREFRDNPEDLETYREITRPNANLLVAETSLKWRNVEREQGQLSFDLADTELAWAEENDFHIKAHVLLWGNAPPLSTGSGVPEWLREAFPDTELSPADRATLRGLIRERVAQVVGLYSGRIEIWDVTNEMLNLFTPWFADRLEPDIVNDIFAWAREADPGAQLVYNEWITEVFTGLPGPSAADVRDRVLELLADDTPIDAVGQQAHFVPGVVHAGLPADLTKRTRIDDYAAALDTLAETGLPIHITEVTFVAPDDPESRAAQAEALMRVWWGHPSVEQVIFWSLWNKLAARNHLKHGIFDDDGMTLTRHGEAVMSLINDRWRTRTVATTDSKGAIRIHATLGDFVAEWEEGGEVRHAQFKVERGPGELTVVVTEPSAD